MDIFRPRPIFNGMNANRIFTVFLRQFLLIKRSFHRISGIFYWSTLDIVLWGLVTSYLYTLNATNFNFATVVLGTLILWNFFVRIQQGITVSFLEDVWTRNFMNLFSSPLSISEYVWGLVLTSVVTSLVSISFMVVLAWLLFTYNIFQFGFMLIPFVAVLFLFGWAVGIFATSVIIRFGPSSEILAWSIPVLLTPLSGVFYPIAILPKYVYVLASVLPSAHVFEGMRSVVLNGSFDSARLFTAFALALISFILSFWFLLRSYRRALRNGSFTRFLTE